MNKVSIDVSLEWFDAAIRVEKQVRSAKFQNSGHGRSDFHKWLRKNGINDAHLFMEATGRYWEDLANWAHKRGWWVTVVNPRRIRKFAESQLSYNKTDKLDAECILLFAESIRPEDCRTWTPRSSAECELKELHMEIRGLQKMLGQEQNRLRSGLKYQSVKQCIKLNIEYLRQQLLGLERKAIQLIKQDEKLAKLYKTLSCVKGFGDKTIIVLLARIDFEKFEKGRQLVAFAGIAPRKWQSGKSVHRKDCISRVGHSDLRSSLYFPAVVSMTHDPSMVEFKRKLELEGKESKVIICAVMASLLRKAFALIRDSKPAEELLSTATP